MKRILILAMALLLCTGLVACGQIEDANGEEETGLAVITKDELLESNSSSKVGYVRTQINNTLTLKVNQFSGVEAVDSISVSNGTERLTFSVQSTLNSGNLYIYVRHDGRIVGEFTPGQKDSLTLEQPAPGKYELCIAGESASFELSATMQKQ